MGYLMVKALLRADIIRQLGSPIFHVRAGSTFSLTNIMARQYIGSISLATSDFISLHVEVRLEEMRRCERPLHSP